MKKPKVVTRYVSDELAKLMFVDKEGNLYKPLEITSFEGAPFLFVSFLTQNREGYIPLEESRTNRCLGYHNNLRLTI